MLDNQSFNDVQNYYGKVLKTNKDLKTLACQTTSGMPRHTRRFVKDIHDEVMEKFYGCGSPIPLELEGCTLLDLGSGSGRDVFVMSGLVGETGQVIGVDMTDEQLEVARRYQDYHAQKFGYSHPNTDFRKGFIEDLSSMGLSDHSIDIVTSNCVLNLSPKKEQVFSEIFRVLKPGGELYFSDIFSAQRVPKELISDAVLLGECLSGAMYIEDFRRIMAQVGCLDTRVISSTKVKIQDLAVEDKIGMIDFYSMTVRAFKIELEDRCEDYGQVAYYLGTIPETPHAFVLDDHHTFKTSHPLPICGNTADMLAQSRFAKHFKIVGDKSRHFGLFDCKPPVTREDESLDSCC